MFKSTGERVIKKKESISNILLYLENRSAIICLELKRIYLGLGR